MIQFLSTRFKVKEGAPKYFLEIEVAHSTDGIYMHQHKYMLDISKDTGLLGAKPSKVPLQQNHDINHNSSVVLSPTDANLYRRLVGRLLYLTVTRPDLSYLVQVLSQHLAQPRHDHLLDAYKVVRYIKGTPGQGLFMSSHSTPCLTTFCDSDWGGGGFQESNLSLTGYAIKFGNTLISWKCKKQQTVSQSSSEAEYRCMVATCNEITWLLHVFAVIGFCKLTLVTMLCDNKSALHIASNSVFHERTKHIDIASHVVCEKMQLGVITTDYITSNLQPVDMFTKAIPSQTITFLLSMLGIFNKFHNAKLRGDVMDIHKSGKPDNKNMEHADVIKKEAPQVVES